LKLKYLSIITASIININSAYAGLIIDTNHDTFIDATTNLEFMDFGINNGKTIAEVRLQTQQGGIYEGWRVANINEAISLFNNAFTPENLARVYGKVSLYHGASIQGSQWTNVFNAMGYNRTDTSRGLADASNNASAFFDGTSGISSMGFSQQVGSNYDILRNDVIGFDDRAVKQNQYTSTAPNPVRSTLLVRDYQSTTSVSVPETSTLSIFALGVLGLVARRFKKQVK